MACSFVTVIYYTDNLLQEARTHVNGNTKTNKQYIVCIHNDKFIFTISFDELEILIQRAFCLDPFSLFSRITPTHSIFRNYCTIIYYFNLKYSRKYKYVCISTSGSHVSGRKVTRTLPFEYKLQPSYVKCFTRFDHHFYITRCY